MFPIVVRTQERFRCNCRQFRAGRGWAVFWRGFALIKLREVNWTDTCYSAVVNPFFQRDRQVGICVDRTKSTNQHKSQHDQLKPSSSVGNGFLDCRRFYAHTLQAKKHYLVSACSQHDNPVSKFHRRVHYFKFSETELKFPSLALAGCQSDTTPSRNRAINSS
jgi:hypothetical protein